MKEEGIKTRRPLSEETKRKIGRANSIALKGRKLPESLKKKISERNKGPGNPSWKGGVRKMPTGYIYIYSPNHPYKTKDGYVLEHRLVMENHLGRYLLPEEQVHHDNGIKSDNRIENLTCFESNSDHIKYHEQFAEYKHKKRSLDKLKKGQMLVCDGCGKQFYSPKWATVRRPSNKRYCSSRCYQESRIRFKLKEILNV